MDLATRLQREKEAMYSVLWGLFFMKSRRLYWLRDKRCSRSPVLGFSEQSPRAVKRAYFAFFGCI